MQHRLELVPVSPKHQTEAARIVEDAVATRKLSNRTNPGRYKNMLAAVMTSAETRKSVDITDLDWGEGKSPAYNLAHRTLSSLLMRPYFDRVTIVALEKSGLRREGSVVMGTSNTTAPPGKVSLFVTPR